MRHTYKKGHVKLGGRKKGSKNKATVLFSDMLNEQTKGELLQAAIQMAKEGNATIMNKLLDKFMPSLNSIDFPKDEDGRFPLIEIHVRDNKKSE